MSDGTTTWTNTYNSDGLRTSRTDGTTTYTYIYDGDRITGVKRNDLNMWIFYDDHGPVTIKYGVGTFHYVTNLQGDVVAIVDKDGQHVVEYTYDAWGKVTSITGMYAYNLGIHNPILYRGYVYDHETGLYYCQSRYYDPEIGRFLNADAFTTTGQGFVGNNMFAYCRNNPVCRVDINGAMDADSYDNDPLDQEDLLKAGEPKAGNSTSNTGPQTNANTGNSSSRFNLDGLKGSNYVAKRGWTPEMINQAISNGRVGESTNLATGNECSVYSYPGSQTGTNYVVIDNITHSLVQLSAFGNTGWIPDKGISWYVEGEVFK